MADARNVRTRVVADADVLAADVLCGGDARAALELVWRHSWLDLVATEPLLDDAEAVLATLGDEDLAAGWRALAASWCDVVDQPAGDHPALAAAYNGEAAHVLSLDERLRSARAGVELRDHMAVSVRSPDAFASVFDPDGLYEAVFEGEYPGPDRGPRGAPSGRASN